MCFHKIRERIRVKYGGIQQVDWKSSAEAEEENREVYVLSWEQWYTSACKTNSMEDQWIFMYKYKSHGVVFGMLYAEKATVNETD